MKLKQQNNISVFKSKAAMAKAAAELVIEISEKAIKEHGKFTWVLSGGSTPENLFTLLATLEYRDKIDWKKTFIFWGDERFVPENDDLNNAFNAKKLLLNHLAIPSKNIFPIPVNSSPDLAAKKYEVTIKKFFGKDIPRFDLIFLGLGQDGHTASLFPGSDVLFEKTQLVSDVYEADQKMYRITITPVLINKAHTIVFLVEGKNKAEILNTVINGTRKPEKFPAQIIHADEGNLNWYVDEKAASLLFENSLNSTKKK